MRILFIVPEYPNIWESLGVASIASYLKRYNLFVPIELDFCHGNFDSDAKIILAASCADIVAFSCTTPVFKKAVVLKDKIKQINPKVKTVVGGWHVTAVPEDGKKYGFDITITGEGEIPFGKLVGFSPSNSSVFEFENRLWPDRELIKQNRTLDLCEKLCGDRIISIQSRRGCMMNCAMCAESCMTHNKKVRVRDSDDIIDELEFLHTFYKFNKFKFVDPTFCYPKSATFSFCETKIRRDERTPWEAMAHAAYLDKPVMQAMKDANCKQLNIGVESGSQEILNSMRKGVTLSKIKKVFEWGHDIGIEMRAFCLLGMPTETYETIEKTRKFIHEIAPDHCGFSILAPYPGSDFYDPVKYRDVDWSEVDEYSNNLWYTNNFTNTELKKIQKELYEEFKDISVCRMHELMKNG